MQPTMKLRLFRSENGIPKGAPFITDSYGRCYVLQQWWEESREIFPKTGQIGLPPIGVTLGQVKGEWRDVPIEVES